MISEKEPKAYLNLLEPAALIEAFFKHPPEGFSPAGIGPAGAALPCFTTAFDLLTTVDPSIRRFLIPLKLFGPLLRPKTLFAGTTVSEYLLYPDALDPKELISNLLDRIGKEGRSFLIIKDVPFESPLLTPHENRTAEALLSACREAGFYILSGQALAYAPIDFDSVETYLSRLSGSRRKNIRRKLKTRSSLEVETRKTGAPFFLNDALTAELYELYLNVYRQSEIHFDRLTLPFFRAILQNGVADGVMFLYRRGGKLIGWNLCFIYGDRLVDKYVGFLYPAAREANLYFISWFYNMEFALNRNLKFYIAGWTDPEVKAALGAKFTFTRHAVYLKNGALRFALGKLQRFFEADQQWAGRTAALVNRSGAAPDRAAE